jgi:putative acetyltransferase
MLTLIRTDSEDADFTTLVKLLDADLAIRDGEEHAFYDQFNKVTAIKHVIVAYDGDTPVGCGAIKHLADDAMEVKRMYVPEDRRGKGIAGEILVALEHWADELGYAKCLLETGTRQPEAIALYKKSGYSIILNYGQYAGVENSVCFEKVF